LCSDSSSLGVMSEMGASNLCAKPYIVIKEH